MKLFFLVNSVEFLYKLQKQADAAKMVDVETEVTDDPDELQRYIIIIIFLGGKEVLMAVLWIRINNFLPDPDPYTDPECII